MPKQPRICALIMAAGRGERAPGAIPKQFRILAGRPVIAWSVEAFRAALPGAGVRIVGNAGDTALHASLDVGPVVPGGTTRAESVRNGLAGIAAEEPDIVLVHDAARPFLRPELIRKLVSAVEAGAAGAVPAIMISDSIKRASGGEVIEDLDRSGLWTVQTPQVFRYADLVAAFRSHFAADATDDVAIARAAGLAVRVVEGDADNFKLTYEADFGRAERMMAARLSDIRTGTGFDVHRFGPGNHVTLCGVVVAHAQGLVGHSDADVGLHALTDAILGAIGSGDIGMHFPPSDERWRGAASEQFLRHANGLVIAKGGMVGHCDVTLICEAPKIGPHREAMVERIAGILGIEAHRVSVKATTTEGLGFAGRREGIAAMASATVRLP